MRIPRARSLTGLATVCLAVLLSAAPVGAATIVYPAGGSAFATNAEGWSPGQLSCEPVALLCTPEAVHETSAGNPPGSIAAKTTVTVNLLNLFKGTSGWESPKFTLAPGAASNATIRLDRAFEPGALVNLEPKSTYTVTLRDLTAGTSTTPLTEEVTKEDTAFVTQSASANVVGGHTYQLSLSATTAQSTVSLALLTGTASLRFDNIGLVIQTPGGGGGDGDGPGGGDELTQRIGASLIGPAMHRGKRVFVKVKCPAAVGATCRITLRGMLNRSTSATRARNARVGKGKTKRVVVKVKPKAQARLASRKRLLFKVTVRAGGARATVFRRLPLIRR